MNNKTSEIPFFMASQADHLSCDICSIVKLKRMASIWRKLTRNNGRKLPADVPPGHVAVLVGEACRRFVIRADYFNLPVFHQLLDQAYEEYGFEQYGPLVIPCDEFLFCDIIYKLEHNTTGSQLSCHVEEELESQHWRDLAPLLQGFVRRSTC